MGALSIGVVERTKGIRVLHAIGTRSRTIMGIFMMQGVLQSVLSWAFSLFVSLLISKPMADVVGRAVLSTPLDCQYSWQAAGSWLVLVGVIWALAWILLARSATRASVRVGLASAGREPV